MSGEIAFDSNRVGHRDARIICESLRRNVSGSSGSDDRRAGRCEGAGA